MALDTIHHSQKRALWRTLSAELDHNGDTKFLLEGATGFPHNLYSFHIDLMIIVYQSPQRNYEFRSIRDCMLNAIISRLWNTLSADRQAVSRNLFFHNDTESVVIRQKKVEQRRRSLRRRSGTNEQDGERCRHDFEENFNFSWADVTSEQHEKNIFASFYVFLSGYAAAMICNSLNDKRPLKQAA